MNILTVSGTIPLTLQIGEAPNQENLEWKNYCETDAGSKAVQMLESKGREIQKTICTSFIFVINCLTDDGLEDLWDKFQNGYWKEQLKKYYINEEELKILNLKKDTFRIHISELDYDICKNSLRTGKDVFYVRH